MTCHLLHNCQLSAPNGSGTNVSSSSIQTKLILFIHLSIAGQFYRVSIERTPFYSGREESNTCGLSNQGIIRRWGRTQWKAPLVHFPLPYMSPQEASRTLGVRNWHFSSQHFPRRGRQQDNPWLKCRRSQPFYCNRGLSIFDLKGSVWDCGEDEGLEGWIEDVSVRVFGAEGVAGWSSWRYNWKAAENISTVFRCDNGLRHFS